MLNSFIKDRYRLMQSFIMSHNSSYEIGIHIVYHIESHFLIRNSHTRRLPSAVIVPDKDEIYIYIYCHIKCHILP